ncbi:hypothetical protein FSU_0152 [Fibrobacter succinogenes subsp. succinogenes S85]|uniref:Uncharacterized protein n=1 Tax=Fibrobacter succinogenes (strain ATCC 19169 / S85) TaxID=59374 RepID=D9S4Y5_FIBSS|nr:hypothetical protein FSU_0152 [Fibrobacter succinogenes subsp. succinogenes S85]
MDGKLVLALSRASRHWSTGVTVGASAAKLMEAARAPRVKILIVFIFAAPYFLVSFSRMLWYRTLRSSSARRDSSSFLSSFLAFSFSDLAMASRISSSLCSASAWASSIFPSSFRALAATSLEYEFDVMLASSLFSLTSERVASACPRERLIPLWLPEQPVRAARASVKEHANILAFIGASPMIDIPR